MIVKAVVVYPIYLEIEAEEEVLKNKERKQRLKQKIFELADNLFESSSAQVFISFFNGSFISATVPGRR